jgi:hypothetical protein
MSLPLKIFRNCPDATGACSSTRTMFPFTRGSITWRYASPRLFNCSRHKQSVPADCCLTCYSTSRWEKMRTPTLSPPHTDTIASTIQQKVTDSRSNHCKRQFVCCCRPEETGPANTHSLHAARPHRNQRPLHALQPFDSHREEHFHEADINFEIRFEAKSSTFRIHFMDGVTQKYLQVLTKNLFVSAIRSMTP